MPSSYLILILPLSYQIKTRSKNVEKMAFDARRDYIEYAVMPMSTSIAPVIFSLLINKKFHDYLDGSVIIYADEFPALNMDKKVAKGIWRRFS